MRPYKIPETEEYESKFDPGHMEGEISEGRREKDLLSRTWNFYWQDMDSFSRFLTSAAAVGGSSMGTAALTYVLVPDFQETAGEFVEDPVDSSIDVVEYLLEETTDLGGELIGLAYSNEAVYQLMDPDKVAEASSYAADIVSSLS